MVLIVVRFTINLEFQYFLNEAEIEETFMNNKEHTQIQRSLVPHCWVSRDIGGDLWLPSTDYKWKCNVCCASGTLAQLATISCGPSVERSAPSLLFNRRLSQIVGNNYPGVADSVFSPS